jgi:hypothetical protein
MTTTADGREMVVRRGGRLRAFLGMVLWSWRSFLSMAFCYDGLERIERKLGSVGMAFVYLVFDTFLVPAFIEYCT